MRDLGAVADDAVFDLHKVAHADMVADGAVWADVGEGAHRGVAADGTLVGLGGVDRRLIPDHTGVDHGVGADGAVFTDNGKIYI